MKKKEIREFYCIYIIGGNMYIDYNKRIVIIALYLNRYKYRFILFKYLLIYKLNKLIDYYNSEYIKNKCNHEIKVNNYSLDKEQLKAIYTEELITLVVAGAGSGKTSLIAGKINYLIDNCNIKEDEILCLSFTNEAVNNLKNRLKYNVDVITFHKLALNIIGDKYKINNNYLSYVIDEYFLGIAIHSKKIKKKLVNLIDKVNIDKYEYYLNNGCFNYLKYTIKKFIELFIVSGKELKDFLRIKKYKKIVSIIIDIYCLYISELDSKYEIDLNLLISKAVDCVNNCSLKYKCIIVDEFQDISKVRMKLLSRIVDTNSSKLLVVGDDYQSIYGFSGSSLESYLKIFKNRNSKVIYLKNNYRCCKEIVNISNKFIVKNKCQIKKDIFSCKSIPKPIIVIADDKLEKLLIYLSKNEREILILGRNNKDIGKYITINRIEEIKNMYKNKIEYKTVHSAKGLEADCVIVINLEDINLGFPNKIKNPDIIDYVFPKEQFEYAEERRLFYVSLTRSKNEVYLLKSNNPSIFFKEIAKDNKKNITYLNL